MTLIVSNTQILCVVSTFRGVKKIKFLNFQVNAYLLHLDHLLLHIKTIRTIVDISSLLSALFSDNSFIIKFIHVEETAVYREDEGERQNYRSRGKIFVSEGSYIIEREIGGENVAKWLNALCKYFFYWNLLNSCNLMN